MVSCLSSALGHCDRAMGVNRRTRYGAEEIRLAYVVRAGAGDQKAAAVSNFERTKVEFLISAQRGLNVRSGAGERRRINDDGVKPFSGMVRSL